MYKQVFYHKYSNDLTEDEKERKFKLIKKQVKAAKSYKECPALDACFLFWNLYRFYKRAAESLLGFKFDINYEKRKGKND